jgi:2-oxoglutarate ferredoxin oxidoreductase subunit alpha
MIGQMMGIADFDKVPERRKTLPEKDWALHGKNSRGGKPIMHFIPEGRTHYGEKYEAETVLYPEITRNETRVEIVNVEDADIVMTAYGTAARMCNVAVEELGGSIKLGLIRPQTLWPFPYGAFEKIGPKCKAIICPEINIIGQMIDDVRIASSGRWPVHHVGDSATESLTPRRIVEKVSAIWEEVK